MLDISFRSGMSNKSDLIGCVESGAPIGVVAGRLATPYVVRVLPDFLDRGGKVFVDSGAFTAFRTKEPMNWPRVMRDYLTLGSLTDKPNNLWVVAPDCVGNQSETLSLIAEWRQQLRDLLDLGVNVIVPLQCGGMPGQEMLNEVRQLLGCSRWVAGIPSNKAAMSISECASLVHDRFHILGRVQMDDEQIDRVRALRVNNPAAFVSADANWLRSRISLVSSFLGDGARRYDEFGVNFRAAAVRQAIAADAVWGANRKAPDSVSLGASCVCRRL